MWEQEREGVEEYQGLIVEGEEPEEVVNQLVEEEKVGEVVVHVVVVLIAVLVVVEVVEAVQIKGYI